MEKTLLRRPKLSTKEVKRLMKKRREIHCYTGCLKTLQTIRTPRKHILSRD
jgi:hypothetical protein